MKTLALTAAVVAALLGTASARQDALECGSSLVVRISNLPLTSGERLVGVEFKVVGGSVVGVGGIPRDWSVSVEAEVSGVASVSGSPGHGAGALGSADQLPQVTVRRQSCSGQTPAFELSAVVHVTTDFESTRRIELNQSGLRIQRAPNSTLQLPGAPVVLADGQSARGAPAAERARHAYCGKKGR